MGRYFSVILLTVSMLCTHGQAIRVAAGKTFQVVTNTTTTTGITAMGQSIDNVMEMKVTQDYSVQSVTPTGYTLSVTTKKITGKINVMGQEQKFDSDDEAVKNNPMLTIIGKPQEIKMENGKVSISSDMKNTFSALGLSSDSQTDFSKLFLSVPAENIKIGYSWTDSSTADGIAVMNNCIITTVSDQQFEVRITSDTKMTTTLKQAGMEMQTDMKGMSTATRHYDKKTGMMISEKLAIEAAGTVEIMGVKAPMTIKTSSESTAQ